jgi:TPR repeat protein
LGDEVSMNNLAVILSDRNDDEAEVWYLRSANLGYARAMDNLGIRHFAKGDFTTSEYWFRKAVDLGFTDAQQGLSASLHNLRVMKGPQFRIRGFIRGRSLRRTHDH